MKKWIKRWNRKQWHNNKPNNNGECGKILYLCAYVKHIYTIHRNIHIYIHQTPLPSRQFKQWHPVIQPNQTKQNQTNDRYVYPLRNSGMDPFVFGCLIFHFFTVYILKRFFAKLNVKFVEIISRENRIRAMRRFL